MVTINKKLERLNRLERTKSDEICPNCKIPYERRKRKERPENKKCFYTEWDYCNRCKRVQHYEEFKCLNWKEEEGYYQHINNI